MIMSNYLIEEKVKELTTLELISKKSLASNGVYTGGLIRVVMSYLRGDDEIRYSDEPIKTSTGKVVTPLPEHTEGKYCIVHEINSTYSHIESLEDLVSLIDDPQ
jgi:hypothetical protein